MTERLEVSEEERGGGGLSRAAATRSSVGNELVLELETGASRESAEEEIQRADGLSESIGDVTLDALQRLGGVAGEPAVALAKRVVRGLNSSASSSPTSSSYSRGARPVVERGLGYLETQMTALGMELNLSPRPHPVPLRKSMDKLRPAESLLRETETKGTLVERMQVLEDRFTAYMEKNEQALSIIQSKLALIDTSKLNAERLSFHDDAAELPESPSGEEFHDASAQESDNQLDQSLDEKLSVDEADHGVLLPGSDVFNNGEAPTETQSPVTPPEPPAPPPEDGADDHKSGTTTVPSSDLPQGASLAQERTESAAQISSGSAEQGDAEKSGVEDSPVTSIDTKEDPQETHIVQETPDAQEHQTDSAVAGPLTSPVVEEDVKPRSERVGAENSEEKHRESEYKATEDFKVPEWKSGSFTSFITEPKPLEQREKKKKEKGGAGSKDKKGAKEEEKKRQDGGPGVGNEVERNNSFKSDQEKSNQPFKQLRDRLRRAFKSKKDP